MYKIELDREVDGRWIADIPEYPGALAYGDTPEEATAKAEAIASECISRLSLDEYFERLAAFLDANPRPRL